MTDLQERLFQMRDDEYAAFQAKLAPTIPPESCIGVRLPCLRAFAKEFCKTKEANVFLHSLPHKYYDENLLHSILLESVKDYQEAVSSVERFLPFVDNWAVCDTLRPKIFAKHKTELLPNIRKWISSEKTYTCRFGLDMLMTHYLDGDFKPEYLEWAAQVKSEEYYVNMMVAWYFATALAKQWDATIPYIEQHRLGEWVHKKSIQKAVESFRLTPGQKEYLKSFRF